MTAMIQENPVILNTNSRIHWQTSLRAAISDPLELLTRLGLETYFSERMREATRLFPLRVPRGFVERMRKGDIHDPLLRQVLPISEEFIEAPGYSSDPVGDLAANKIPGLLHKYQGRVLLTLTGTCAVNCRYCFRREFPYTENNPGTAGWQAALDYIAADPSITEVIFSGGDPLVLPDASLAKLVARLEAIPHLTTVRIHSRLPIVLPERITSDLIEWFSASRLKPVMVIHCNHPNEIDAHVTEAIARMRRAGITVLNQSVLLKGVNDTASVLISLSQRLFEISVLPYYVHLLDKVRGSAHFEVSEQEALSLQAELKAHLPGYLVPRFVREEAGASSKTLLL
jgi:EF-P beta-lysylation protein EpmB